MVAGNHAPEVMLPGLNSHRPLRAEPAAGPAHAEQHLRLVRCGAVPAVQRQQLLSASSPAGRQNVVPVAAIR
ncbi:hypothetical protein AC611_02630 [Xanthomonas phaseoli pv. phaseoli]|nr:hypothetical protein AC609_02625 [Xanthomonas phaseoli pv. phaseoli]AZU28774.1 hypothetical protein AC801_02585 [Xanthomonas sp. ISO98C4]AZU24404.1 hypothetical protein AC611_02630 [Xanthomonas phaseoli pv. phaseoli]AZU33171.1 hypothetical protein AC610_02625 [Xanthomonas phaseoli pv. phaseoli]KKW48487.1 hypothetical protein RN20_25135 [Xanthomonas phaseoli pv. phaseoli]